MYTKTSGSYDESDNGKYIIVKYPRRFLHGNEIDPSTLFSNQRTNRRTLRAIGFIVMFLLGIVIGSIFHDHILHINSYHATWKMFTTAMKIH